MGKKHRMPGYLCVEAKLEWLRLFKLASKYKMDDWTKLWFKEWNQDIEWARQ